MIRALYFWARWALANALFNISANLTLFARKMAPRPIKMRETPS